MFADGKDLGNSCLEENDRRKFNLSFEKASY
jgi:hypothetical protein